MRAIVASIIRKLRSAARAPLSLVLGLSLLMMLVSPCEGPEPSGEPEMEPVTVEERAVVVERVSELLTEYYVFPDVAEACIERVNARLAEGAYDEISRPNLFVAALNEDLQAVSGDKHLKVVALFGVENSEEPDAEAGLLEELDRHHFFERGNYGIIRVEWLKGNIGYVDLRAFASLYVARDKFVAATALLSNMDAVIIDLRSEVMGGPPETVQFLASYFFDEPTHLSSAYFRKDDVTEEMWTLAEVPGKRIADVPLYILTNEDVFSAGEGFTYALQALGRATVIGETTMGGAHITRPFPIGTRFRAMVPWARSFDPVTGANWEGVGITPDVVTDPEEALDVALEMATEAAEQCREVREAADVAALETVIEELKSAERSFAEGDAAGASSVLRNALERGVALGLLNEGTIDDIGYYYLDSGKIDVALEVFACNARLFPDSYNAYHSLGEAYVRKGDRGLAVANLERSLEINPHNGWATKLLGNIDDEIGKVQEERP
jgi:tetratricopeptide (TPR) repeat protein